MSGGVGYLGGKSEALRLGLRDQLLTRAQRYGCVRFFDLFCGSGKVSLAMADLCVAQFAADVSAPIVCLLRALRDGWLPPTDLSYDLWRALRQQAKSVGLLGVFFRGFKYGAIAKVSRSAVTLGEELRRIGLHIQVADYRMAFREVVGVDGRTTAFGPGDVVYCDIPYDGTATYATAPPFDAEAFWRWAVRLARRGVLVLVSEYGAPPVGLEVWRCERRVRVTQLNAARKGDRTVIEKLYEVIA